MAPAQDYVETCGYCTNEYLYSNLRTNNEGDAICPPCRKEGE